MHLTQANVRNYRRLEDVSVDFEERETAFVGPNNSGKTSVTDLFRLFLGGGEFTFFDFSASVTDHFNVFGEDAANDGSSLPAIDLDLWFSVDSKSDYGRVAMLLPDLLGEHHEVGLRLRFAVQDSVKLREDYAVRLAPNPEDTPTKPMTHYLSLPGVLTRHCGVEYYKLERAGSETAANLLPKDRGKPLLKSLIQVRYVEAQRGLDDHERGGSTLLSKVFTSFYRRHLDQAEASDEANLLIDKHNDGLTEHFGKVFAELLESLRGLGVPSVNDRTPRIISALQSEVALQSNTTLAYVDPARGHMLPESYNGLGVKNLIYMTLRICDHHLHWMQTKEARPACMVVFVEEPEVHLHAQAQQTFIGNVWSIIREAAEKCGQPGMAPQLVVTTHSSHVLDTVNFDHVRYFRRCYGAADKPGLSGMNASCVQNLKRFSPTEGVVPRNEGDGDGDGAANWDEEEISRFLKRYMRLTHCDLFFADAAVLVEGSAEKLLLSDMIDKSAPDLRRSYLTVLEVSGAYAHRFAGLMRFLGVPYLVITDIDSVAVVEGKKRPGVVRADHEGATTANGALKALLAVNSVQDCIDLSEEGQILDGGDCFVTYQKPSEIEGHDNAMHGRTFEDTFVYENIGLFRAGSLSLSCSFQVGSSHEEEYQAVFEAVHSRSFKKTEFALNMAHSKADWSTPDYIASGLRWLEQRLRVADAPQQEGAGNDGVE